MTPKRFMIIAGEASGDLLAAELVQELRRQFPGASTYTHDAQPLQADLAPRFFGAGGPRMAAAGVELAFDLVSHAVVGITDVLKNYGKFRRMFGELLTLARNREPDVIVCVDYAGFNRRFAHAVKKQVRARRGVFNNWEPKIVQYVSPQVWASREGRAYKMARDFDLLLSIFPFEKAWYAARTPRLRVVFVGHPLLDRHRAADRNQGTSTAAGASPVIALLPGSRQGELDRHLPVMIEAFKTIQAALPSARGIVALPGENLAAQARRGAPAGVSVQVGGLAELLAQASLAIASTGTVTMECALFRVPTVALYMTSWTNYQIGKRLIHVRYLAMPNLLAGEEVFPEFIQDAAPPPNIARAALDLLRDELRRAAVRARLDDIVAALGGPGASARAAREILALLPATKA
jgi:lipid-A-disaccharide synthase